jgi:hypothetical protein
MEWAGLATALIGLILWVLKNSHASKIRQAVEITQKAQDAARRDADAIRNDDDAASRRLNDLADRLDGGMQATSERPGGQGTKP